MASKREPVTLTPKSLCTKKKNSMPLSHKGKAIMSAMDKEYGDKKSEEVFYASKNAGKIKGVEKAKSKALKEKKG